MSLKEPAHRTPHRGILLSQEDGGSGASRWKSGGPPPHARDRSVVWWEIQLEGAAPAHLAVDPDMPSALLDDSVYGRQAEPGPLPWLLRGEEGLEDSGASGRVHSAASVGHDQDHVH